MWKTQKTDKQIGNKNGSPKVTQKPKPAKIPIGHIKYANWTFHGMTTNLHKLA